MDKHAKLRTIVATLSRAEPEAVTPDFSLAPLLSGSLNAHLLESAVRVHLGIVPPRLHGLRTFSELEGAVLGVSGQSPAAGTARPAHQLATAPTEGRGEASLACGLDVEQISKFPLAQDYWTHEFYTSTFTSTEIAYCVRQADPRPHFAVRWCAKEALKKCAPGYLEENPVNLQVHHDEYGAPVLQLVGTRQILPYAVSLSHSDEVAAAVVISIRLPATMVPPQSSRADATIAAPAETSHVAYGLKSTAVALGFALIGMLISCAALLRVWSL